MSSADPHPWGAFMRQLQAMRAAQIRHFVTQTPSARRDANATEARVDAALQKFFETYPAEKPASFTQQSLL